jgi:hypothetical protein
MRVKAGMPARSIVIALAAAACGAARGLGPATAAHSTPPASSPATATAPGADWKLRPGAPILAFTPGEGPAKLVPKQKLALVFLECTEHVVTDARLQATGGVAGIEVPKCRAVAGTERGGVAPYFKSTPLGQYLASTFALAPEPPGSAAATSAATKRTAEGGVIVMRTTDDMPQVWDDGCGHMREPHPPCDAGPRRMIDEGHHVAVSVIVLGTGLPVDLAPASLAPLAALLGVTAVPIMTTWADGRDNLLAEPNTVDQARNNLDSLDRTSESDADARAVIALVRAELATWLHDEAALRGELAALERAAGDARRADVRAAVSTTLPLLRDIAAGKLGLHLPASDEAPTHAP